MCGSLCLYVIKLQFMMIFVIGSAVDDVFFFFKQKTAYEICQTCALPISTFDRRISRSTGKIAGLLPRLRLRELPESAPHAQIGRASCRERVEISVVAVSIKKKNT